MTLEEIELRMVALDTLAVQAQELNMGYEDTEPYRNDAWELSQRDSEIILDAMKNPPPASQALVDIFKKFKHTHNSDDAWDGDYTMEK